MADERGSNKRHMAVESVRPIRAVAPEAGESRWRAAGAEPKLEAAVRDEIEHRRILSDPDRLVERQGHDARAEANSRRACRDMSEKHEWGGQAALIAVKMMLSNPG